MKTVSLLIIILLSLVHLILSFNCPTPQGAYPDDENCHAYWRCHNSVPMHMTCPLSLNFDPVLKICDDLVDCKTSTSAPVTSVPTTPPQTTSTLKTTKVTSSTTTKSTTSNGSPTKTTSTSTTITSTASTSTPGIPKCKDWPEWIMPDDSSYCYHMSTSKMNWTQAIEYCHEKSGYLAEIKVPGEERILEGILDKEISYWIGLNDLAVEGQFEWAESKSPLGWSDWFPGQPGAAGGTENCVLMYKDDEGWTNRWGWNDVPCLWDTRYGYPSIWHTPTYPIFALCQAN